MILRQDLIFDRKWNSPYQKKTTQDRPNHVSDVVIVKQEIAVTIMCVILS